MLEIAISGGMIDERAIRERYEAIRDQLDERGRRLFAAAEARSVGRGGVMAVSRATGLARSTIERGLKDLDQPAPPAGRIRRAGSGRRRLTAKDPTLLEDLRRLVEPVTLGDPMRPLLWVSKSHVKLAKALQKMGHAVSPNTVRQLLHQLGYGRRANRKANDGRQHADREVLLQSSVEGKDGAISSCSQAAMSNSDLTKAAWATMSSPPTPLTCPFLIIASVS